MEAQQPTSAPDSFIRLLKRAMAARGLSLRQFADKTAVSPSYLSRLLNRERGVPAEDTIARFEEVLDIEPRGRLFDAAKRHDPLTSRFLQKENARLLMRTLAPLSNEAIAKVLQTAQQLAMHTQKYQKP